MKRLPLPSSLYVPIISCVSPLTEAPTHLGPPPPTSEWLLPSPLAFSKEIVHELLGDVAKLVLVLPSEVGDRLLGNVSKHVLLSKVHKNNVGDM